MTNGEKPTTTKGAHAMRTKKEKPTKKPKYITQDEINQIIECLIEVSERRGFGRVTIDIFAGDVSEIAVTFSNPEKAKPSA